MKPKRLARKNIYQHFILDVHEDRVEYPHGRIVERHAFLEFHNPGVGVVVQNDQGDFLMVNAYRYILDTVHWEIPAGGGSKEESISETARREVLEETGYEAQDFKHIHSYYPTNGIADQRFEVFTCKATKQVQDFDRAEIQDVRWFSLNEIVEMIKRNQIKDGFSLTGLLLVIGGFTQPA